jgi:hypothetical protein
MEELDGKERIVVQTENAEKVVKAKAISPAQTEK